jgi:hypothetical protein
MWCSRPQTIHRFINGAAHILARTCDISSTGFISDFAPDCIRETLCISTIKIAIGGRFIRPLQLFTI